MNGASDMHIAPVALLLPLLLLLLRLFPPVLPERGILAVSLSQKRSFFSLFSI